MPRAVAFVPDLLFGSRVLAELQAAGCEATLIQRAEAESLTGASLLVVDLTTDAAARIAQMSEAMGNGPRPLVLAFYSHVEADVRALAEGAGFDLVVPRSRMAREGAALVRRLLSAADE